MTHPAPPAESTIATRIDVLIVGAGPAGIAAATAAAHAGASVLVLDDNPHPGGQIWRQTTAESLPETPTERPPNQRARALARLARSGAQVLSDTRVFAAPMPGTLQAYTESTGTTHTLRYRTLILATGARERFLPFPGWTLPGVFGAGGLQALVQGGFAIDGKRVLVAGTGPLLLAVAAHLRRHGARVVAIAEQAPLRRLLRFSTLLPPAKLLQGLGYRLTLGPTPFRTGAWPVEALPDPTGTQLAAVRLTNGRRTWLEHCDLLACGFHLVPNTELASLLGLTLHNGFVPVDETQRTALPHVYCAGEPTGIGGINAALLEGRIAGIAAAGRATGSQITALIRRTRSTRRFAKRLARAFALRPELRSLAPPETLICRCEDVPLGALTGRTGWTEAKLHTRCGMGPCQGRICGPAAEFLLGWQPVSVRPPLYPVPLHAFLAPETLTDISQETPCTGPA